MLFIVYDEFIFECDEGYVDEFVVLVWLLMEGVYVLKVLFKVDVGYG